jgi:hypothetical protein
MTKRILRVVVDCEDETCGECKGQFGYPIDDSDASCTRHDIPLFWVRDANGGIDSSVRQMVRPSQCLASESKALAKCGAGS